MSDTEEIVGAEPTEQPTEELAGAEPVVAKGADDIWGADHPEDTLSDEALTEKEGEGQSLEGEIPSEKTPVQTRINELTKGRKAAEEREAQTKGANDYLTKEIARLKQEASQVPPPPAAKEPAWEEFEEKFADDPDKATREYLVAKQEYNLDQKLNSQKQQEALRVKQATREVSAKKFQEDSNSEEIKAKYPDFHAKVYAPHVKFNNAEIANLIQSSPQRFDIAYKIANDSTLLARINSSTEAEAGAIIGDIQRLYASPVNKRLKTKAPRAVPSIGSDNKALTPKEEDMDIDDFLKMEDAKQAAGGGW